MTEVNTTLDLWVKMITENPRGIAELFERTSRHNRSLSEQVKDLRRGVIALSDEPIDALGRAVAAGYECRLVQKGIGAEGTLRYCAYLEERLTGDVRHVGQGDTLRDAIHNVAEAFEEYLESCSEGVAPDAQ